MGREWTRQGIYFYLQNSKKREEGEKVKHAISLAVDILDPMLVTQIDNLFTYIEELSPSKNKEKIESSEYEESKEKIMHLRERLEEFVTTKKVLK